MTLSEFVATLVALAIALALAFAPPLWWLTDAQKAEVAEMVAAEYGATPSFLRN